MTKLDSTKKAPLIKAERTSIRLFTTLVFISSAVLAILVFLIVSNQARNAALELQKKSLSRVISVATDGVLTDLRDELTVIGNSLQHRPEIRQTLKEFYKNGNSSSLVAQLDDPLVNGYVGAVDIELVKLRIYNKDYRFIAESSRGMKGLKKNLPEFISTKAKVREGANSLMTLGGLWTDNNSKTTLYSLLLPIGGFKALGYIEVIINPVFNLIEVGKLTQKPLTIYSMKGEKIEDYSPINNLNKLTLEEIEYTLIGDDNKNAFRMVLLDDVSEFNQEMGITRITAIASFASLTIVAILIVLSLMNRFLFKPIQHMTKQMQRVTDGELSIKVDDRGLKDFHDLALNFNTMRKMVENSMQTLEQMSLKDPLTGIGNRRIFDQTLKHEWLNYMRNGKPLSLIIFDIDFFKQFNDLYGHQKGDKCIQQVAQVISKAIYRPSDIACRYGGEEFTLILPDTTLEGALYIAGLVRQLIDELRIPHRKSLVSDFITLSMGIATTPLEGVDSAEELIKAADTALYLAKEKGRNQVRTTKD